MEVPTTAVDVPVPPYFLCPISLELMGDPVTLPTGITYDRTSIDRWLSTSTSCPVTKQPVPEGGDLTPNHTLRRLIQQWCAANAAMGVQRIPTPRAPLDRKQIEKIIQEAAAAVEEDEEKKLDAVRRLSELVAESERNRRCSAEAGAAVVLASILKCCSNATTADKALQTLHAMELSEAALRDLNTRCYDLVETLMAAMKRKGSGDQARTHALLLLKALFKATSPVRLAAVSAGLFTEVVRAMKDRVSRRATRAAMRVLAELCPWGRNRIRAAEAGALGALVDILLEGSPSEESSREAEMALTVMEQLCTSAEGREALATHPAGLAAVGKRVGCTGAVGERAVRVLWWVGKYAPGGLAAREMLEVGAVANLCIVAQAKAAGRARDKARELLGWHARAWSASPCLPKGMLAWELPRRT